MSGIRRCQIADCQNDVAPALSAQGTCLDHYLELVFVRLGAALELCQTGRPIAPGGFDWLLSQGELAARALGDGGGAISAGERTRLLEMLLCLANLSEYAQHHSIEPPPPARLAAAADAP